MLVLALLVLLSGLPLLGAMPVMSDCPRCLAPAGGVLGVCLAIMILFLLVRPRGSGRLSLRGSLTHQVLFVRDLARPPRAS